MLSPIPSVSLVDPEDADALVCQEYDEYMSKLTPCSSAETFCSSNVFDDEDDMAIRTYDPVTCVRSETRNQLFKPETLTNDLSDDEDENPVQITLVNAITTDKTVVKLKLVLHFINDALTKLQSTGSCPSVTIDTVTTNHLLIYIFANLPSLAPTQEAAYVNQIKVLHLGRSFTVATVADLSEKRTALTSFNLTNSPCFHFLICPHVSGIDMAVDKLVLQTMMTSQPSESSVTYAEAILKKVRKFRRKKHGADGPSERPARPTADGQAKELRRLHRIRQTATFFVHGVM